MEGTQSCSRLGITEDGLFQFGHSKDRRQDLPQVKVMLSVLDPLGMPAATQVLPRNSADDRCGGWKGDHMERAEIGHPFPSARKESRSKFAETNRVYQIDHKIPEKLLTNKRTMSTDYIKD